MIYTLTLNPSLDYTMTLERLDPGSMNRAREASLTPGGKGINVSCVLDSLGYPTQMLGFLAGFTGDEIEKQLTDGGHRSDFIHLSSGLSRINVKLCSSISTEVNADGPSIDKVALEQLYSKLDRLTDSDVLVMSGAIPSSLPDYTYRLILDRLADRAITAVVDATGQPLLSVLPAHPFLIKPNRHELEELFSTHILLHTDVDRYARKLQELGARNVLVSLDREGAVLVCEDGSVLFMEAPDGVVLNPVGAGDSMLAGFIFGWLETGSYSEALKAGIAAGSATAFSTSLASADDILSLRRLL